MSKKLFVPACIAVVGMIALAASWAAAESSSDAGAISKQELKLPPGFTEEDLKACIAAGTPGPQHKQLTEDVGEWHGTSKMWMAPDTEPIESECTATITSIMDGRFTKCQWEGSSAMGPYTGLGLYGFDNVAQKYVAIWIDNHSTGIMQGEGELSGDGKTLTLNYTFNCPMTKKPTQMRSVETTTGPDTKTLEMFSAEPKTGEEYKMMSIELTRK